MAIFSGSLPPDSSGIYPALYVVNSTPSFTGVSRIAVLRGVTAECEECTELSITITPIDHTTIRVNFSSDVINNRALLDPLNYIFTPWLVVSSVTPNSLTDVSYVDLEVYGMTNQEYSLTIQTIEAI